MIRKNSAFINDFQFMNSGLESLFQNLPKDKFKYMFQTFQENQL